MNNRFLAVIVAFVYFFFLCVIPASADAVRTQNLHLHKGWNAVFMEVDPINSRPADLFQGTPVTIAAAFTGGDKTIEFVQNPTTNTLSKQNGWDVWYAPSRADSFLTSVFQIVGNKPYLLYSESDFTLPINGNSLLNRVKWRPNSFSLAGFGVDDTSPPTFAQFFGGSVSHQPYRIYRLVNDAWVKVDNAQTSQMQAGEAYWIYCRGGSDYQGPITVSPEVGSQINLQGGNLSGVLLQNKTSNPLNVRVQNVTGSAQLPLAMALRAVTGTNVITGAVDMPDNCPLQQFDPAEKRGLWLTLRPERMNVPEQAGLLKITTDLGTQCWLPVSGKRSPSNPVNQ